jgi:DNA-binding LacI/PurR family transcriptional regulator
LHLQTNSGETTIDKTRHITIKDVAAQAGVSIQTVSRVINGRPDVSPETRKDVQATIDKSGYQPFANARGLAAKRTYTLGLISGDFSDIWFAHIATGAEKVAREHGYYFFLGNSNLAPEDESGILRLITQRHVEGVLFVCSNYENEIDHLSQLREYGVPIVTVGYLWPEIGFPMIDVDNIGGGRKATEHLIGLGHKHIAMITGPTKWKAVHDRTEGYLQALHTAGIPVDRTIMCGGGWEYRSGYENTRALLEKGKPFTAIFAHNDRIARGALQALFEAGLRVPDDVSIIGYDDTAEAEFSDPPLTTINQPMTGVGEAATRFLIQMIEDPAVPSKQVLFNTTLVIRSSCAPVNPKRGGE